ncbi:MAG TPA: mechanosensitive ion channel family protein [Clostridia bacterium]|nr:mechanosensitive ion channel family protein [Clostridia bacterium]
MEHVRRILTSTIKENIDFLRSSKQFSEIMRIAIKIILIIIIARLLIKVINSTIDKFVEKQKKSKLNIDFIRVNTMKGLMKSAVKYIIYFIAFTAIIKFFGIEVTGLIATAGIGGLALGFGAQNLVRDIITGFFILFEEQFGVGNYVEINGVEGIVEEMALRVTKIRDFGGNLHIIPNGEIGRVANKSSGKTRAFVEISIAYEENIDNAMNVLERASEKLKAENDKILEGPSVLGVSKLEKFGVAISITAKTVPMEHWGVERLMRKTYKEALDEAGIGIPYEKIIITNNNKTGNR